MKTTKAYAHETEKGFRSIGPHHGFVYMHDYKNSTPIIPVTIQEDEDGPYWSWWNNEEERFTMTWPSLFQLEMCFPYGMVSEEKSGRGQGMSVSVTRREDEPILSFSEWEKSKL